jgi:predicted NUDIX family NTP pyrophosphohydrolase
MAKEVSAGLLMYRVIEDLFEKKIEVFLVHPGGPFFSKKDNGFWGIPKGLVEGEEDMFEAAKREFKEETGIEPKSNFIYLEHIKLKGGKVVHAWAFNSDIPEKFELKCNSFEIEWPPKSGKKQRFPEVDKWGFFGIDIVREKMNKEQFSFVDRLLKLI